MALLNGVGTTFYGQRNYKARAGQEEYETTKWLVFIWIPLIPLGSFRIRRAKRADVVSRVARNVSWSEMMQIIAERPLDWPQVLRTYLAGFGCLAAIVGALAGLTVLLDK